MRNAFTAAMAVSLLVSSYASADGITDDELSSLFQKQAASVSNALGLGTTRSLSKPKVSFEGDTRGLSLVVLDDEGKQTEPPAAVPEAKATSNPPPVVVRYDAAETHQLRIEFAHDSAIVPESELAKLDQVCRVMNAVNIETFRIVGHTDSSGSDDYNLQLSSLRAEEVGRHLIRNCGISAKRLQMIGYGERFPFNPNNAEAPENRRVEFQAIS